MFPAYPRCPSGRKLHRALEEGTVRAETVTPVEAPDLGVNTHRIHEGADVKKTDERADIAGGHADREGEVVATERHVVHAELGGDKEALDVLH